MYFKRHILNIGSITSCDKDRAGLRIRAAVNILPIKEPLKDYIIHITLYEYVKQLN